MSMSTCDFHMPKCSCNAVVSFSTCAAGAQCIDRHAQAEFDATLPSDVHDDQLRLECASCCATPRSGRPAASAGQLPSHFNSGIGRRRSGRGTAGA
jgi:hypothetical protein